MKPHSPGPAAAGITVIVTDPAWRRSVPQAERLARRAAAAAGIAASIVLTDDRTVRRLNAHYRGRNAPTNVLTFESDAGGDILLALGTIRREAAASARRPRDHLTHLVVHGALHLLGHDHDQAGEARRMELAEARLTGRLGAGNPWRHRPSPARSPRASIR